MESTEEDKIFIYFRFESRKFRIPLKKGVSFLETRASISNVIKLDRKGVTILDSKGNQLEGDLKSIKFEENQDFIVKRKIRKKFHTNGKKMDKSNGPHVVTIAYKYKDKIGKFDILSTQISSNNIKYNISKNEKIPKHFLKLIDNNNEELQQFLTEEHIKNLGIIIVINNSKDDDQNILSDKDKNKNKNNNKENPDLELPSPSDKCNINLPLPSNDHNQLNSNNIVFLVRYNDIQKPIQINKEGTASDLEKSSRVEFKIPNEVNFCLVNKANQEIKSSSLLNEFPNSYIVLVKLIDETRKYVTIIIKKPESDVIEIETKESNNFFDLKEEISSIINHSKNEFVLCLSNDFIIDDETSVKGFNNLPIKLKYLKPNPSNISQLVQEDIKSNILNPRYPMHTFNTRFSSPLPINMPIQKGIVKAVPDFIPQFYPMMHTNLLRPPFEIVPFPNKTQDLKEEKLKELKAKIYEIEKELESDFTCPICFSIFKDPVSAIDGFTYDKDCIDKWLAQNDTSPMTKKTFQSKELTNVQLVKNQLIKLKENLKKLKEELLVLTS